MILVDAAVCIDGDRQMSLTKKSLVFVSHPWPIEDCRIEFVRVCVHVCLSGSFSHVSYQSTVGQEYVILVIVSGGGDVLATNNTQLGRSDVSVVNWSNGINGCSSRGIGREDARNSNRWAVGKFSSRAYWDVFIYFLPSNQVAHQAILFILDVLIRNNQAMAIVKLYDSFADRTFTPQMLRAVGGNEQGLQQFLLRYPSLFTVNNDTVSANSATPVRTINVSKSHSNRVKSAASSASTSEAGEAVSGTDGNAGSASNATETVWDAKTMREIEQEAINFFRKQLSKREEEWLPIVSVAGHASQSSADVRKYVGPQNEFKNFLSRYPHVFVVRDDFCGLKVGKYSWVLWTGRSSSSIHSLGESRSTRHPVSSTFSTTETTCPIND